MIDRPRLRRIMTLSLPIIGGMMSQNVLNLVDTAMVGMLGNAALAAVGMGGFANFMCMALILGISTGVQAMSARRKGAGELSETARPLNAGLLMVLAVAPALSVLLYIAAPWFYPLLNGDPEVIEPGVPYLQMRLAGITFVGMNFAFRGFWNAIDRSSVYMTTLIVMHVCNILLNYMLIFGKFGAPELGATGAGLGTTLSTLLGTIIYLTLGWRQLRPQGFLHGLPSRTETWNLLRLSLPSGVQQLFFSTGFVATYWIIGLVGTRELAAANVLINVTLVAILPGLGLGLAAATLVGQALGRDDAVDAEQWGWDVTKIGVLLMTALGLPMLLVPDLIMTAFIHDAQTLDVGRLPMRIVGATMAIEAVGMVLMHALLGAGDAKRVMVVAITTQWAIFLPLAYMVGPVLGLGLVGIWIMQGIYRIMQAAIFLRFWSQRGWVSIKV
ncbi:MAG: MATE family efflux transporter [Gammaproteobacteria bacterium]|nr:MATE family efflux transporter [Gammaproteobacteria bacterium]NNM20267.1 MATE family efflux transporter [Gammaproteobacteria bacterium]